MINHDNLDCVLSPIINNYISGRIQTTIIQNYTFIILSKYKSRTSSVSPSNPAATGINKNRFSCPSGATVGSVIEGTLA